MSDPVARQGKIFTLDMKRYFLIQAVNSHITWKFKEVFVTAINPPTMRDVTDPLWASDFIVKNERNKIHNVCFMIAKVNMRLMLLVSCTMNKERKGKRLCRET